MKIVILNYYNNAHSSLGPIESWEPIKSGDPQVNLSAYLANMDAQTELRSKLDFGGIRCDLLSFGGEPTMFLSLDKDIDRCAMTAERKIEFINKFKTGLAEANLHIDAVVAAHSDCSPRGGHFSTFFNQVKAIDPEIRTVEIGADYNRKSNADYKSETLNAAMEDVFLNAPSRNELPNTVEAIESMAGIVSAVQKTMLGNPEKGR